jgi:hypothetical protein
MASLAARRERAPNLRVFLLELDYGPEQWSLHDHSSSIEDDTKRGRTGARRFISLNFAGFRARLTQVQPTRYLH